LDTTGKPHEAADVGLDIAVAATNLVPVVGGFAAGLITAVENRRSRRVVHVLEKAVKEHGLRIERLEEAAEDGDEAELLAHTLRVALDARSEEKLDVLASIVAAGLRPGSTRADTERFHLLLNLLSGLEGVHIEALMLIGGERQGEGQLAGMTGAGITLETVKLVRSDLADIADAIVSQLEAQGLVRDVTGTIAVRGTKQLAVTPLGQWFLRQLAERATKSA
jgi:hypothetical protein